MAATTTKTQELSFGNVRGAVFRTVLTGVTEVDLAKADHGFSNILFASFNNQTTEGDGKLEINYTVADAASIGNIALTGFTSGDTVDIFVLGH